MNEQQKPESKNVLATDLAPSMRGNEGGPDRGEERRDSETDPNPRQKQTRNLRISPISRPPR